MKITKEFINSKYVEEKKSLREIGKLINKSPKQISRYLKDFGIKARPFSTKGLKPRLGAILSEETKDKIRQKHFGKKLSPEHRAKVIKTLRYGLKGKDSPSWKGGRVISNEGYVFIRVGDEYIKEHRLVMERHLNRILSKNEIIHHKNGNKQDNRIENLEITNQIEHGNIHWNNPKKRKWQSEKMSKLRKERFWSTRSLIN